MSTSLDIIKAEANSLRAAERAKGNLLSLCQGREKLARQKGFRNWATLAAAYGKGRGGIYEELPPILRYASPRKPSVALQVAHLIQGLKEYSIPEGQGTFWLGVVHYTNSRKTAIDVQNGWAFQVCRIEDENLDEDLQGISSDRVVKIARGAHKVMVAQHMNDRPGGPDVLKLYASSRKAILALAHDTRIGMEAKESALEVFSTDPRRDPATDTLPLRTSGHTRPFIGAIFVALRKPQKDIPCLWPVRERGTNFRIEMIDPFEATVTFTMNRRHGETIDDREFKLPYAIFRDTFEIADEFGD